MNKDQAKKSEKKTLFRRCSSQTKQFLKDIILNTDQKLLWILASNKKKKDFDLSARFHIMHRGFTKSTL